MQHRPQRYSKEEQPMRMLRGTITMPGNGDGDRDRATRNDGTTVPKPVQSVQLCASSTHTPPSPRIDSYD